MVPNAIKSGYRFYLIAKLPTILPDHALIWRARPQRRAA
jgi:hypothetical protein